MSGAISRFIYADDSGYLDKGWIVFGWLELSASDWDRVLAHWLAFRKELVADYSVPVVQEIHILVAPIVAELRIQRLPTLLPMNGGALITND